MDVIVESDRDKRTLAWLIAQVGEKTVELVCSELSGTRRPYVSNLAKALGLVPPDSVIATSPAEAKKHLAVLKCLLRDGSTDV